MPGGGSYGFFASTPVIADGTAYLQRLPHPRGRGGHGTAAPNLGNVKPDAATAEEKVRFGGGGMPAFGATLSDNEITAVAAYVAATAGKGGDSTPAP